MQAQLLLEPPDAESRRVGRDDERADLGVAVVAGPGPGGDDVRAGLAGVGDEPLGAVEDPRPAVGPVLETGGGARPARVAAGARLGQAVRADDLAARHRDEEPRLLLGRPGEVERAAAEAGVGGDDQPERAPHPADLLDRDRVRQGVETGAALVLRERDAEPAELADPPDDLDREAPLALVLVDDRCDLGDHEIADGVAEQGVLRGEVEVHRPERTPAPTVDGSRC